MNTVDIINELEAEVQNLRKSCEFADAVARLWIIHMMSDERTRLFAHPLAMVREALAGQREAVQLGCDDRELRLALLIPDLDDLRNELGIR